MYYIINTAQESETTETKQKLQKYMIKYSSYTNQLRFFLRCHNNKIFPKDLQLKNKTKTKQSKTILQCAGKLLFQERIPINHVICEVHPTVEG